MVWSFLVFVSFLFCLILVLKLQNIFEWWNFQNIPAFFLKQDFVYSHQLLAEERLLDSRSWQGRSYKKGSVFPSFCLPFCLFLSFFQIRSLFVFENWHDFRGPYIVVCDSRIFLEKIPIGQKWSKIMVFWTFKENDVISFVWNLCKMKVLMVH